jgi:hypothetical protein
VLIILHAPAGSNEDGDDFLILSGKGWWTLLSVACSDEVCAARIHPLPRPHPADGSVIEICGIYIFTYIGKKVTQYQVK